MSTDSSDLSVFFVAVSIFFPTVSPPPDHLVIILYFHTPPSCTDFHGFSSSPWLPCSSSSHPSVPYHYYEPSGPDECSMYLAHERSRQGSHHRFITEKMVFANWAQTLNVHFYQPDWRPAAVIANTNTSNARVPVWILTFTQEMISRSVE